MNNTNTAALENIPADEIATHRNDSRIKKPVSEVNQVAALHESRLSSVQREWLAAHGFELHADEHGNVHATHAGKSIGDDNAQWVMCENMQLWEVSAKYHHFMNERTGRFHLSLISHDKNGRERVYDAATNLTLRAALEMVLRFTKE